MVCIDGISGGSKQTERMEAARSWSGFDDGQDVHADEVGMEGVG